MKALDEVIELYSWALTRGSDGQKIETYTKVAKVFGRVTPLMSEVAFDYNQEAKRTAVVEMYKRKDLTSRWRVCWKGAMFNISGIDMGERISPFMKITIDEV